VTVGGREFVVRPMLGATQREMETAPPVSNTDGVVAFVAAILKRTAPEVSVEWLLANGDTTEYTDVMEAFREVTTGRKEPAPGEAPAP